MLLSKLNCLFYLSSCFKNSIPIRKNFSLERKRRNQKDLKKKPNTKLTMQLNARKIQPSQ